MNVLNLPGGGTKFIGIVTLARKIIDSGYKPDVITGISAGAIACVPIALGKWTMMMTKGVELKLSDLFKMSPVSKKGRIRITKALFTHGSLGVQRIDELLAEFITLEDFEEFKTGDYPDCYVQSIGRNKQKYFWNLKELSYDEYLQVISASSAIPVCTQPIRINGVDHFDGGLKDITMTQWVLNNLKPTEIRTIYSKPKGYLPGKDKQVYKGLSKLFKFIKLPLLIIHLIEMLLDENRGDVADFEVSESKLRKIKLKQYFLPNVLRNTYDVNHERLFELLKESYKIKV